MAKVRVYLPVMVEGTRSVITWQDADNAAEQQPFVTTDKAKADAFVDHMAKTYQKDYRVLPCDLDVG